MSFQTSIERLNEMMNDLYNLHKTVRIRSSVTGYPTPLSAVHVYLEIDYSRI